MVQTITATYVQRDEDWKVSVSGLGRTLDGEAPGIIAARDRADQLVEELVAEGNQLTVVHLLNGSAFEFTSTYMEARLMRTDSDTTRTDTNEAPADETVPDTAGADDATKEEDSASEPAKAETSTREPAKSEKSTTAQANDTDEQSQVPGQASTPTVPRKELDRSPEAARTDRRYARAAS